MLRRKISFFPLFSLVNIALNKPSFQSSQYNQDKKPSLANDGDIMTVTVTSYSGTVNRYWWYVDLQEVVNINRVIVYLSKYAFRRGYYKEIKVQTKKMESDVYSECHRIIVKNTENTILCDVPTQGRFVRVVGLVKFGEPFYLTEVEVYKL